jgi:hypothetical protein
MIVVSGIRRFVYGGRLSGRQRKSLSRAGRGLSIICLIRRRPASCGMFWLWGRRCDLRLRSRRGSPSLVEVIGRPRGGESIFQSRLPDTSIKLVARGAILESDIP